MPFSRVRAKVRKARMRGLLKLVSPLIRPVGHLLPLAGEGRCRNQNAVPPEKRKACVTSNLSLVSA